MLCEAHLCTLVTFEMGLQASGGALGGASPEGDQAANPGYASGVSAAQAAHVEQATPGAPPQVR